MHLEFDQKIHDCSEVTKCRDALSNLNLICMKSFNHVLLETDKPFTFLVLYSYRCLV